MTAGYSGTPLAKKIGLKHGMKALLIGVPSHIPEIGEFAGFAVAERAWSFDPALRFDYIHVFETERRRLEEMVAAIRGALEPDGMAWISWPKKASRVPTTITEDALREIFLPTGLVDVKVAAIDAVWSGLKFMIRKELRGVTRSVGT